MNEIGETISIETKVKSCRDLNVQELMQLLKMNISIFWSWGAHNFIVDNKKRTRMFRMNVSGHHFKGHVYIFVNGSDLFDVYLTTPQGIIKDKIEGLYFDDLVDWIDTKVEKISAYND
jgi:hypothetical protein